MGLKIIMVICTFPILPIIYIVLLFISDEKNGMQFGVTLWEGAKDSQQMQEIRKMYKKELNLYSLGCFLLFCLTLLPKHSSLLITAQMIWMFFTIFILYVPFVRANSRTKEQKREYKVSFTKEEETDKVFVDVTAALAEKPKLFRKSLFWGSVFTFLPVLVEYVFYYLCYHPKSPDLWICELTLLSVAVATLFFPLFVFYLERQQTSVITCNSQINLQLSRVRKYHLSKYCMLMTWLTGAFNWGLLFTLHLSSRWFLWATIGISLVFAGVSIVFTFHCWNNIEKVKKIYLGQEPLLKDSDEYWIWGLFYYNKNDNRSMVENRVGIGVTGNMAKPKIKYTVILTMVVLFLSMFWICGWIILEEFTPISISYEADMLTVTHWKKEYQIKNVDIKEVTLLEEEPEISRRKGTEMQNLKKGDFYSSTERKDLKVCFNPQEPPFLMVEKKDGTWYLLGGNHEQETRDIWQYLQEIKTP